MSKRDLKTTRQHYEKYRDMAKATGVTLKDCKAFGSKAQLERKFDADPLLNNIPLRKFDVYFSWVRRSRRNPNGPMSLAENCCLYKHLLTYEIIGAVPEFTD